MISECPRGCKSRLRRRGEVASAGSAGVDSTMFLLTFCRPWLSSSHPQATCQSQGTVWAVRFTLKLNLQKNTASKSVFGKGQYANSEIFVEFAEKQSFEVNSGRCKSSLGQ